MQHACIDCAAQAMERFNIEKDIAACAFRAPPKKQRAPAVFSAAYRLTRVSRRRRRRSPRADIKKEFDKKYGPTWHVIVGRCVVAAARNRARCCGPPPPRAHRFAWRCWLLPPPRARTRATRVFFFLAPPAACSNFGSYVTHETKHFIYFYLGQVAILCFKSG